VRRNALQEKNNKKENYKENNQEKNNKKEKIDLELDFYSSLFYYFYDI